MDKLTATLDLVYPSQIPSQTPTNVPSIKNTKSMPPSLLSWFEAITTLPLEFQLSNLDERSEIEADLRSTCVETLTENLALINPYYSESVKILECDMKNSILVQELSEYDDSYFLILKIDMTVNYKMVSHLFQNDGRVTNKRIFHFHIQIKLNRYQNLTKNL